MIELEAGMNRNRAAILVAGLAAWMVTSRPASADITAFVGLAGGPATRTSWGVSAGLGMAMLGFEFEYGNTHESFVDGAPRVRTVSGNLLLQTPMAIGGVQIYGTAGAGGYHQDLGIDSETNASVNLGGGVKVKLVGPLRLRVDYRVFRLLGSPIGAGNLHRVYVGGNIGF
jgi:hypothetical protein